MSLVPFYDTVYPSSHHHFGAGYHPSDFWVSPVERSLAHSLHRAGNYLRSQLSNFDGIEQKTHIGKDGFQICLDVQHFLPNEITVKTENQSIVVHAKHEEKQDDHGYITREFTRRYDLPKEFKVDYVTSNLSSDGILAISCPHTPALEGGTCHVPIQQTGPARHSIKANEEKK